MSEKLLISYVLQLANDLEMPEVPAIDAHGFYYFSFGESLSIGIKAQNIGFYFTAKLGPIPDKNLEDFFLMVMHANLFGIGTGGGAIALDPDGKILTFTHLSPYQMTYGQFKEQVEDYVNYVDLWQKKTADAQAASSS